MFCPTPSGFKANKYKLQLSNKLRVLVAIYYISVLLLLRVSTSMVSAECPITGIERHA